MITANRQGKALYPFASLAIGEEFTAARNMGKTENYACKRKKSMQQAAAQYGRKHGGKFEVRIRDATTVYCRRIS